MNNVQKNCTFLKRWLPLVVLILFTTAGVAVLLTIITYFSTPILTKIFGDGSLEVGKDIYVFINKIISSTSILNIRVTTKRTGCMMRR